MSNIDINSKLLNMHTQSTLDDIYLGDADITKTTSNNLHSSHAESLSDVNVNPECDNHLYISNTISDSQLKTNLCFSLLSDIGLDHLSGGFSLNSELSAFQLNTHLQIDNIPKRRKNVNRIVRKYPILKDYLNTPLSINSKNLLDMTNQTNTDNVLVSNFMRNNFMSNYYTVLEKSILHNRTSYQSETTGKLLSQLGLRDDLLFSTLDKDRLNQVITQEVLFGLNTKAYTKMDYVDNISKIYTEQLKGYDYSRLSKSIRCTDITAPIMQGVELDITVINNLVYTTSESITIPTRTGFRELKSKDQILAFIDSLLLSVSGSNNSVQLNGLSSFINSSINNDKADVSARSIIPGLRLVLHDSIQHINGLSVFNYSLLFDECYLSGINSDLLYTMSSKFVQLHITNIQIDTTDLHSTEYINSVNKLFNKDDILKQVSILDKDGHIDPNFLVKDYFDKLLIDDLHETEQYKYVGKLISQGQPSITCKLLNYINHLKTYYKALNNSALDLGNAELIGIYQENGNTCYYYSYVSQQSTVVEKLDSERFKVFSFSSSNDPTPNDPYLGGYNTVATLCLYAPLFIDEATPILRPAGSNLDVQLFSNIFYSKDTVNISPNCLIFPFICRNHDSDERQIYNYPLFIKYRQAFIHWKDKLIVHPNINIRSLVDGTGHYTITYGLNNTWLLSDANNVHINFGTLQNTSNTSYTHMLYNKRNTMSTYKSAIFGNSYRKSTTKCINDMKMTDLTTADKAFHVDISYICGLLGYDTYSMLDSYKLYQGIMDSSIEDIPILDFRSIIKDTNSAEFSSVEFNTGLIDYVKAYNKMVSNSSIDISLKGCDSEAILTKKEYAEIVNNGIKGLPTIQSPVDAIKLFENLQQSFIVTIIYLTKYINKLATITVDDSPQEYYTRLHDTIFIKECDIDGR